MTSSNTEQVSSDLKTQDYFINEGSFPKLNQSAFAALTSITTWILNIVYLPDYLPAAPAWDIKCSVSFKETLSPIIIQAVIMFRRRITVNAN